jgi:hypothetical protein
MSDEGWGIAKSIGWYWSNVWWLAFVWMAFIYVQGDWPTTAQWLGIFEALAFAFCVEALGLTLRLLTTKEPK